MPRREPTVAGLCAVAGALVGIAANVGWPRGADPGDAAAYLRALAAADAWRPLHLAVVASLLLATAAFVLIGRWLGSDPGAMLPHLGHAAGIAGGVLGATVFSFGGFALQGAARACTTAVGADERPAYLAAHALLLIDAASFSLWIIVWLGLAFGLTGAALTASGRLNRMLCGSVLPVSIGAIVLGAAQYQLGYSKLLTDQLFAGVAGAETLWLLAVGVALLRYGGKAPE